MMSGLVIISWIWTKSQSNKNKMRWVGLCVTKRLLHSRGNAQQSENELPGWKQMPACLTSQKRLISKICKELVQKCKKKKKWAKDLSRNFCLEVLHMVNTHTEWSSSREHKSKAQREHLVPARMAGVKNTKVSIGENVEKLKPPYTAGANVKWHSRYGQQ